MLRNTNANLLTELLQLFELKDFLLSLLLSWAVVQGRALQQKPTRPPVVQVMAFFVVQSANQLPVPLHQSLDFSGDEALRVMWRKKQNKEERMKKFHVKNFFAAAASPPKQRGNTTGAALCSEG